MKTGIYTILAIFLISCSDNSNSFEGEWKCDQSSDIFKFEKVNSQSYLYYYPSGNSETAIVNEEGVLEMRGFVFTLNAKTGQLILPNAWNCNTATKLK